MDQYDFAYCAVCITICTANNNFSYLPISPITDQFDHLKVDFAGFTPGPQCCTQTVGLDMQV